MGRANKAYEASRIHAYVPVGGALAKERVSLWCAVRSPPLVVETGATTLLQNITDGWSRYVNISCVDCSFQGELAVAFNVHVSNTDWRRLIGPAIGVAPLDSLVSKAEVKLHSIRPIEAKMNYQVDVETAVKLSWPGLRASVGEKTDTPSLGNVIMRKINKTLFKVSYGPSK